MPLDETTSPIREELRYLANVLRHPKQWPEGFRWDYQSCDNCAMGLAEALHMIVFDDDGLYHSSRELESVYLSAMARRFAIPYSRARDVFWSEYFRIVEHQRGGLFRRAWVEQVRETIPRSDVTPEMVADAIEAYLAETVPA